MRDSEDVKSLFARNRRGWIACKGDDRRGKDDAWCLEFGPPALERNHMLQTTTTLQFTVYGVYKASTA